jgi:hypothetical protein
MLRHSIAHLEYIQSEIDFARLMLHVGAAPGWRGVGVSMAQGTTCGRKRSEGIWERKTALSSGHGLRTLPFPSSLFQSSMIT